MQGLAAAESSGHLAESSTPVETDGIVSERLEIGEIAARPAAQIENAKSLFPGERTQECLIVLRHIVVLGPLPEGVCTGIVMLERHRGDSFQVL